MRSRGQDGGVHWVLTTVAALYWRIHGDAEQAIRCLRHSLNNAPNNMRVSVSMILKQLINVIHRTWR